jgi:HAD superfamily hydrolase (TIGR01484 family)
MNKIKLIVADIDECITPFWKNHIDLVSMAKLQEYCLKLHSDVGLPKVVLNSGRQVPYAEMVVQMLGIFSDYPSVLESGVMLYYPKTRKVIINPNISAEVIDGFVKIHPIISNLVKQGANREVGKEVCDSLNPPVGQNIEEFFKKVHGELSYFWEWTSITHSKTAVDITPKGMNKGSAVNILEKETPFKREEMLAIGDSESDLDIMKLVGFVACPANANENVKRLVLKKGGYISSFSETKGVVDIFENLILK